MKLRSKFMLFTAALALSTGMAAAAAITGAGALKTYQDLGYTYVEVKEGLTQIKVEAVKGTMYIEVIYDKATGDVIKTESGTASAEDAGQTGTSLKLVDRDFEVGNDVDDDDDDDLDADDEDDTDEADNDEDDNDADHDDDEDDDHDEDDSDEDDDDNSGSNGSGGDDNDCDD